MGRTCLKNQTCQHGYEGKNDRKDAIRIAEYAIRYQDKQIFYQEPSKVVKELDNQINIRTTLIDKRTAIENQLREAKSHDLEEFKALNEGSLMLPPGLKLSILPKIVNFHGLDSRVKCTSGVLPMVVSISVRFFW